MDTQAVEHRANSKCSLRGPLAAVLLLVGCGGGGGQSNTRGPLGPGPETPFMTLCGQLDSGDVFTDGETLIRNPGEESVSIRGVKVIDPDGIELVGVYAYDPVGAGFITYGFKPGDLQAVGVPPEAALQPVSESSPYVIEPGTERALLFEFRLLGSAGRVERVRVSYSAGGREFVHDGGITFEARRTPCE